MAEYRDIVVIGAGIAGMTAAIYAARAGKSVQVLECEGFGGQIASSPQVENYPGIASVSGAALSDAMYSQASALGVQFSFARAAGVQPQPDGGFVVPSDGGDFACRSVVLAAGARHKGLGLPREQELTGRGISYCAVCDGAFYRGKTAAVVGGGSAALQSAEYLCGVCEKVLLIHRRDEFRGEAALARRVTANPNLELMLDSVVTGYLGQDRLTGLTVENKKTGARTQVPVDGVFLCVGQAPGNGPFAPPVELDEAGYVKAGEDCRTSVPGLFAAGDCRAKSVRQLTTAAADGTVAAVAACAWADAHPAQ